MATAALPPRETTGSIGYWNGTKDNQEGYIDYQSSTTNVTPPLPTPILATNIRALPSAEKPTLPTHGFEMLHAPTTAPGATLLAHKSPEGKAYIEGPYYQECADIVKKMTNAPVVIPYHFRVRSQTAPPASFAQRGGETSARALAHLDRDPETFPSALREAVGSTDLLHKHKHHAQINLWRPLLTPAKLWPLVFIDKREIPEWTYEGWTGKVFSRNDPRVASRGEKSYDSIVKGDARYRYFYASELGVEECFVFWSFHCEAGMAVPHSAFWEDGGEAGEGEARRSIEVRCLVFWD